MKNFSMTLFCIGVLFSIINPAIGQTDSQFGAYSGEVQINTSSQQIINFDNWCYRILEQQMNNCRKALELCTKVLYADNYCTGGASPGINYEIPPDECNNYLLWCRAGVENFNSHCTVQLKRSRDAGIIDGWLKL